MLEKIRSAIKLNGLNKAAELINKLPTDMRESLLAEIAEQDPGLSEQISQLLFTFDHLFQLDDASMQKLMAALPQPLIVKALRGLDNAAVDCFLNQVSRRKKAIILDEVEVLGKIPSAEVFQARKEVLQCAIELADAGQLSLPGGGQWLE